MLHIDIIHLILVPPNKQLRHLGYEYIEIVRIVYQTNYIGIACIFSNNNSINVDNRMVPEKITSLYKDFGARNSYLRQW